MTCFETTIIQLANANLITSETDMTIKHRSKTIIELAKKSTYIWPTLCQNLNQTSFSLFERFYKQNRTVRNYFPVAGILICMLALILISQSASAKELRFRVGGQSRARNLSYPDQNKDRFTSLELDRRNAHLAILADGVSTTAGRKVGSQVAIDFAKEQAAELDRRHSDVRGWVKSVTGKDANQYVLDETMNHQIGRFDATTVVAVGVDLDDAGNPTVFVGNRGDSPCAMCIGGQIFPLTVDHTTFRKRTIELGLTEKEALEKYPNSDLHHSLEHHLGMPPKEFDFSEENADDFFKEVSPSGMLSGDWIGLASDGVTNVVPWQEMNEILKKNNYDPDLAAKAVVELAASRYTDAKARGDDATILFLVAENAYEIASPEFDRRVISHQTRVVNNPITVKDNYDVDNGPATHYGARTVFIPIADLREEQQALINEAMVKADLGEIDALRWHRQLPLSHVIALQPVDGGEVPVSSAVTFEHVLEETIAMLEFFKNNNPSKSKAINWDLVIGRDKNHKSLRSLVYNRLRGTYYGKWIGTDSP